MGFVVGTHTDAIQLLTNVLPVTEVDVAVRETYVTDVDPTSLRAWTDLLQDITLLRLTDEADGYYYGAVTRPGGAGITGLAYVSSPPPSVCRRPIPWCTNWVTA